MSNVGKWDGWYAGLKEPQAYGDTETYQLGAEHLEPCALVEDWGCGKGWLTKFVDRDRYRGIDGSHSPFADEIVDLTTYRSETPGVFMRHVLEHNEDWATILDNALASFTERMALVLFTPMVEQTLILNWEDPPGVPNIAFARDDIEGRFPDGVTFESRTLSTATQFGTETIFLLERQ